MSAPLWAQILSHSLNRFLTGRAVDVASLPSYTTDDAAPPLFDKSNGGLLVSIAGLSSGVDSVLAVENLAAAISTLTNVSVVTATGTGIAVNLPSVTVTKKVRLYARPNNIGRVYIGGSDVTNSNGTKWGAPIDPDGWEDFYVSNSNLLWINADNATDGVTGYVT
jgi:hypothetical protein